MVGPITDEERLSFLQKAKAGFVLLVALSAGLIALQADAGLSAIAGAVAVGGLAGIALIGVAFPSGGSEMAGRDPDGDGGNGRNRRP
ncbi:MAG: hypothetical protein ABEH56_00510 [Salinirussus sp.]